MSMNVEFKPVAIRDRIQTLDVVRGFALLGIALMNVEFFNRPIGDLDAGMPAGIAGIDYWAGWFVHVFVRGKFWTMFSLLFGMGFAVMLTRAEQAGRGFFAPYLRRTLALAAFGALHFIFLWTGDILFSYAAGALLLMLVFYSRPQVLLWLGVLLLGLAAAFGAAGSFGHALPWQPMLGFGIPLLLFGVVAYALRRWPLSGLRAAGLALYLIPALAMTIGGAVMIRQPPEAERDRTQQLEAKTPEQKKALADALEKRAGQRKEHAQDIADETRLMSTGSYADATAWRAQSFVKHSGQTIAFAVIVLGLFLLGAWFIRSGVMADPASHLGLFRQMAWIGIPLGIGLSLASAGIALTHVRGQNDGAFQLATGLAFVGNLPACLGYMGVVVLLFHGRWRNRLAQLAPVGRMALSNYILQSALGTLFFYGYGLGHWGMPRAQQVLYVLVVFGLQLLLSRWWLANFRFGPLEWVWRWITYGKRPSMRIAATD
jgi:uncharacterized protein